MIVTDMNKEELETALQQGMFTQMATKAIIDLSKIVEIAMNTWNEPLIDELEVITQDMFQQARKALNERKTIMQ